MMLYIHTFINHAESHCFVSPLALYAYERPRVESCYWARESYPGACMIVYHCIYIQGS